MKFSNTLVDGVQNPRTFFRLAVAHTKLYVWLWRLEWEMELIGRLCLLVLPPSLWYQPEFRHLYDTNLNGHCLTQQNLLPIGLMDTWSGPHTNFHSKKCLSEKRWEEIESSKVECVIFWELAGTTISFKVDCADESKLVHLWLVINIIHSERQFSSWIRPVQYIHSSSAVQYTTKMETTVLESYEESTRWS